jgi:hypothetical protein
VVEDVTFSLPKNLVDWSLDSARMNWAWTRYASKSCLSSFFE